MKSLIAAVPLFLFVALLPGYGQGDKKPQPFTTDLFPLKVGHRWVYQGVDPKEKITITVDHTEPVKRRTALPNGGEKVDVLESYVLRLTSGDKAQLEQVLVTDDGVYRYAAAGKEITPPIKLLKLPVADGDTWRIDSQSENVPLKGEFVVKQTTVDLPGKKGVPAWLSKTRDFTLGEGPTAQKMESSYWFVPGVGIVKQHVKDRKTDLTITLESYGSGSGAAEPTGKTTLPKLPPPLELK